MAWAYNDYITMTGAGRLERLRLHIREVSDAIATRATQVSSDNHSKSQEDLLPYLQSLIAMEQDLAPSAAPFGGRSYARLSRAR